VAVAKIADQTNSTSFDVTLTSPGGTGNGTWSGGFQGECETEYKINNVKVTWTTTHNHDSTVTPGSTVSTTTGTCPVANQPPEIVCLDPIVDLGELTGCLDNGDFSASVNVSYAFADGMVTATISTPSGDVEVDVATVTDPDGDPLTVDVSGPTSLTFVGPGADSVAASVDIDADDGTAPVVSETCGFTAEASVVYDFGGFQPPLSETSSTCVKRGRGIPVKFRLYDCAGNEICTDLDGGAHVIDVIYCQGAAPDGEVLVEDAGSSNDDGLEFRYSGECGVDGNWIFNLKTNDTYYLNSTYKIIAELNDGTTHEVHISIKR
jgi:hypothetical protein